MKRRVLFIVGTLQSGGVSKSMVNLLNAWDKEKYDTFLLLCCKEGDVFSKYIPNNVHIIYNPIVEHIMGGYTSAKWLLRHRHIILCFGVLLRLFLSRISRSLAGELIAKMMPIVSDEYYDLIVDYGGQQLLYYMVNKMQAGRKVTFFHNDYSKWPFYYKADKKYYPQVDHIFSISQTCVDALKKYFPDCANKISIMENISSVDLIREQAESCLDDLKTNINGYKQETDIILCTVAHICRRTGSDFTIEAAEYLRSKKIKFKWFLVGKILESDLIDLIKRKKLDSYFIFAGIQSNPYPYMNIADIYVQPSRFEGKSISLDEAKILCKPIIVTNFSTVHDQFENKINASICKMDGKAIGDAIIELINNTKLRQSYIDNLSSNIMDNSTEVEKLYRFL